jgi:hypothetical protein
MGGFALYAVFFEVKYGLMFFRQIADFRPVSVHLVW